MTFTITYTTLFEIFIHHDYFLDDGTTKFVDMTNPQMIARQLARYSFRDFTEIVPTAETARVLKNQRMIINRGTDYFRIAVSAPNPAAPTVPLIPVSDALELRFLLRITDPYFANFTNLIQPPNRIFLFTNVRPASHPTFPVIAFLGTSDPPTPVIDDTFLASESLTATLTAGMTAEEKEGLFGLFVIRMSAPGDNDRTLLTTDGKLKAPFVQFMIRLVNRKRYWKYKKTSNGTSAVTVAEWPLTKYGLIPIDGSDLNPPPPDPLPPEPDPDSFYPNPFYPNPTAAALEKDGGTIYSVIFL